MFCGARDTTGNVDEPPAALQVETLDITPPVFVGGTPAAESIQEDSFAFLVQLDEPGTVRTHPLMSVDRRLYNDIGVRASKCHSQIPKILLFCPTPGCKHESERA